MPVSVKSDLVLSWSVSFFLLGLPLRPWKKLTSRTQSETQKDHLTVKTTEKKKQISLLPLELGLVFSRNQCRHACVSSGTQPEVLPKRAS